MAHVAQELAFYPFFGASAVSGVVTALCTPSECFFRAFASPIVQQCNLNFQNENSVRVSRHVESKLLQEKTCGEQIPAEGQPQQVS